MSSEERPMVAVDGLALQRILVALNGPPHYIREIQATRGPMFPDNPLDILTDSFNKAVAEHNAKLEAPCESPT